MKESTSPTQFLSRTAVASLVTGLVAALAIALLRDWAAASGFVLALLWGLGNFGALAIILRALTDPRGPRMGVAVTWIAIKLVVLYGLAVGVLLNRWFPLWAFAAGFSWPLLIGGVRAVTPSFLNGARARHAD